MSNPPNLPPNTPPNTPSNTPFLTPIAPTGGAKLHSSDEILAKSDSGKPDHVVVSPPKNSNTRQSYADGGTSMEIYVQNGGNVKEEEPQRPLTPHPMTGRRLWRENTEPGDGGKGKCADGKQTIFGEPQPRDW
jgi:hypothetical protein